MGVCDDRAGPLTARLDALLNLRDPGLQSLGIEIMIAHALKARAEQVAAIVAETKAAGELRAQALRLMADGPENAAALQRTLEVALRPDAPAPLHRTALELVARTQPDRLVAEARTVLTSRSIPEKQHALALLAQAGNPGADAVLAQLADALLEGSCAPELRLDVLEALGARGSVNRALAEKLERYSSQGRAELLAGGDIANGRNIVASHLNANCTACHSVETNGGSEVGPNLRSIGSQRDPAYLLEALLNPSATIATGYGIVSVTLKDRSEVTGTLARETPADVTVRLFDGAMTTIPRAQIANRTAPASIMPPMLGILQPREIRDVVAYLSSLRPRRGEGRGSDGE